MPFFNTCSGGSYGFHCKEQGSKSGTIVCALCAVHCCFLLPLCVAAVNRYVRKELVLSARKISRRLSSFAATLFSHGDSLLSWRCISLAATLFSRGDSFLSWRCISLATILFSCGDCLLSATPFSRGDVFLLR